MAALLLFWSITVSLFSVSPASLAYILKYSLKWAPCSWMQEAWIYGEPGLPWNARAQPWLCTSHTQHHWQCISIWISSKLIVRVEKDFLSFWGSKDSRLFNENRESLWLFDWEVEKIHIKEKTSLKFENKLMKISWIACLVLSNIMVHTKLIVWLQLVA